LHTTREKRRHNAVLSFIIVLFGSKHCPSPLDTLSLSVPPSVVSTGAVDRLLMTFVRPLIFVMSRHSDIIFSDVLLFIE
jgi:hypothetical protein